MPLLSVQNISYTYPDGTPALSDISFSAENCEKIALVGHNGSGKSTLLLLLSALLLPSAGTIVFEEIALSQKTKSDIRKRVGILFPQVEYQFIMPDCLNDVMLSIKDGTKEARKTTAMEYLRYVNLEAYVHQNPLFLSSGQMKRAALASVLAKKPKLLLLDEPLANLDRPSSNAVIDILSSLDIAIVFATHARHAVETLANRVIVLDGGRIIYNGPSNNRRTKHYYSDILL